MLLSPFSLLFALGRLVRLLSTELQHSDRYLSKLRWSNLGGRTDPETFSTLPFDPQCTSRKIRNVF